MVYIRCRKFNEELPKGLDTRAVSDTGVLRRVTVGCSRRRAQFTATMST